MADPAQDLLQKLKAWRVACAPDEYLQPNDPRYVNLNEVQEGKKDISLRGEDYILPLLDGIRLNDEQSCQLFSGFSGTGKSTELQRLRGLLEDAGYIVLYSNAADYHDLSHALDIETLLVIIASAFGQATKEITGKSATELDYMEQLVSLLQKEINLDSIGIKVLKSADLKFGLEKGRDFWLRTKDEIAKSPTLFREHAHDFITQCKDLIETKHPQSTGVVFILDSFEKLQAPEGKFHDIMSSVVDLFTRHDDTLHLPRCHVIYTVPPYLQHISTNIDAKYEGTFHILPLVKVLHGEQPYEPGVRAMRGMLSKRIPLGEIFGDDYEQRADSLIHLSGGHVRSLLSMVSELLKRALRDGLPLPASTIKRVLAHERERHIKAVRPDDHEVLKEIMSTSSTQNITREQLSSLANLMNNQLVLCYRNGEGWYEVHPLIREYIKQLIEKDEVNGEPPHD